jgi:hypothetical protein
MGTVAVRGIVDEVLKRQRQEEYKLKKQNRRALDPRDPRLIENCRFDSDPPFQGTAMDGGFGYYRPAQEAS